MIHRRQFGGGTPYPDGPGNTDESIQPLTEASRVHRRGRGGGRQAEEGTPTEGEEEEQTTWRKKRGGNQNEAHHKIVHRAGGRG